MEIGIIIFLLMILGEEQFMSTVLKKIINREQIYLVLKPMD